MKYTHNLISKYLIARIVKYAVNITYSVLEKVIGNECHEKNILINAHPLYGTFVRQLVPQTFPWSKAERANSRAFSPAFSLSFSSWGCWGLKERILLPLVAGCF